MFLFSCFTQSIASISMYPAFVSQQVSNLDPNCPAIAQDAMSRATLNTPPVFQDAEYRLESSRVPRRDVTHPVNPPRRRSLDLRAADKQDASHPSLPASHRILAAMENRSLEAPEPQVLVRANVSAPTAKAQTYPQRDQFPLGHHRLSISGSYPTASKTQVLKPCLITAALQPAASHLVIVVQVNPESMFRPAQHIAPPAVTPSAVTSSASHVTTDLHLLESSSYCCPFPTARMFYMSATPIVQESNYPPDVCFAGDVSLGASVYEGIMPLPHTQTPAPPETLEQNTPAPKETAPLRPVCVSISATSYASVQDRSSLFPAQVQ